MSALSRALAFVAIAVGVSAAVYGGVGYLTSRDDAFAGLLLVLIAVPAVPPVVLGVQMLRAGAWAGAALRWYLLALLSIGAWLHLVVGLSVFAPPSFGALFIGSCLAWVALSFMDDRRRGSRSAPR